MYRSPARWLASAFQSGWFVAGLLLVLGVALPVQAQYESESSQLYGKHCQVGTSRDVFTDQIHHYFQCLTNPTEAGNSPGIVITSGRNLVLDLYTGHQISEDMLTQAEPTPVKIRIDQNQAHRTTCRNPYAPSVARVRDQRLISRLLQELPFGQHVHIQVGYNYTLIPLDGAREALDDFIARMRSYDQP